jgi:hypothetical protein
MLHRNCSIILPVMQTSEICSAESSLQLFHDSIALISTSVYLNMELTIKIKAKDSVLTNVSLQSLLRYLTARTIGTEVIAYVNQIFMFGPIN